jgi:alpha-beta hydrolase superfamily lysophospholipase
MNAPSQFALTEEQRALFDEADRFGRNELLPLARRMDDEEWWPDDLFATLGVVVALGEGDGADQPSVVFAAMFGGFNEPFAGDGATGFEWLSRDAEEVRKYGDGPWCGFPLSNGYVADMLAGTSAMWTPEAEANIRTDLPIYVMGGDQDPVGGANVETVHELVGRYEALGAGPVTLKLYPGGRHEMLNELNRDEVERDLVAWIDSVAR